MAHFTAVLQADPAYRNTQQWLEDASHQQTVTRLQGEARRLSRAKQWAAVVKIGERLEALDAEAADPEGLVTAAHAELARESLHRQYRVAVRHMDAGEWEQAMEELEQVAQLEPGYRDTDALLARVRRQMGVTGKPGGRPLRIVDQPKAMRELLHPKGPGTNNVAICPGSRWLRETVTPVRDHLP